MPQTGNLVEEAKTLHKALLSKNGNLKLSDLSPFLSKVSAGGVNTAKSLSVVKSRFWFDLARFYAVKLDKNPRPDLIKSAHDFLNVIRRPELQKIIYSESKGNQWFEHILTLIEKSNFTLGKLFLQRAEQYQNQTLFQTFEDGSLRHYSWLSVQGSVFAIARSLLHMRTIANRELRVAIFSGNSLEMACIDIACLACGIVNVPIPVNSTGQSIEFIINHSEVNLLFISGKANREEFKKIYSSCNKIEFIISVGGTEKLHNDPGAFRFDEFLQLETSTSKATLFKEIDEVKIDDLATIMYTSGTTQTPKGIMFSQRNIVTKRFARAIALPEIGDRDKFICYLPLFHTFGRYFEMLGSIFWGATYVFLENPSIQTIIRSMQQTRPTIFISIPKKWIQLFEKVGEFVDTQNDSDEEIRACVQKLTGARLKWGLSAAGYLDPDIFSFFQRNGIEIMSGFGMTEATGGITMTPPFEYRHNSVGLALPGIETKLDDDGEMLIRGPYVMMGYLDDTESGLEDGWFRSGDIFKQDKDGHFQIIDRKKEIYKNIRGETISPQKIENLFADFDSIKRVFVVGDHKEYNTLLLYPNYDYEEADFAKMSSGELRSFFNSLIVSVNKFLVQFERITNFAVIDRDFSEDSGELTAKGTYKRKTVEQNFSDVISGMYEKNFLPVIIDGFEIRIPSRFLREKALTLDDFQVQRNVLLLKQTGSKLTFKRLTRKKPYQIQIGTLVYSTSQDFLDLGEIITNSNLNLGNMELVDFVGDSLFPKGHDTQRSQQKIELVFSRKVSQARRPFVERFLEKVKSETKDIEGIYLAAYIIQTWQEKRALKAIDYLQTILQDRNDATHAITKNALMRTTFSDNPALKRRALQVLVLNEKRDLLKPVLDQFLLSRNNVLDAKTIKKISEHSLSKEQLQSVLAYTSQCFDDIKTGKAHSTKYPITSLLKLLSAYGICHPISYKLIRSALVKWYLFPPSKNIMKQARIRLTELTKGFREWLGANLQVAVDFERHREFRWRDVISFEECIPENDRGRITGAIENGPLIREAVFLFSGGRLVPLHEIPEKGVWVSLLGSLHGKSVYRVTLQTHSYGSFDLAINLNKSLNREEIESEINWLMCTGSNENLRPLVEDFGGYWSKYDLWTEEFVPGETVEKFLQRIDRQRPARDVDRVRQLWTSFVWNGVSAYVDFWNRTGRQLQIADPTPTNVIVPSHDFQIGFRIVAISDRKPFSTLTKMILSFKKNYVEIVESRYPPLKDQCSWSVIFSAFLEILGEDEGLKLLQHEIEHPCPESSSKECVEMQIALKKFVSYVARHGYKAERLFFAIQRFKRWHKLNPDATAKARVQTLLDLRTTYILDRIEKRYPGSRIQFYRDTVFAESDPHIREGLCQILLKMKKQKLTYPDLQDDFAELQNSVEFTEEERTFLTRLSYPHLGARESAEMISLVTEGAERTALMVFTSDFEGNQLAIRSPASPKEIARLHTLFTHANLPVNFQPTHQFLVVLNPRGLVIGGLFFRKTGKRQVHLEKVVVDEHQRRKNVSEGLLKEFFNRLRSQGIEIVTVGFLRPEYFYRFGFRIDHRYGNMVKKLNEEIEPESDQDLMERIV